MIATRRPWTTRERRCGQGAVKVVFAVVAICSNTSRHASRWGHYYFTALPC